MSKTASQVGPPTCGCSVLNDGPFFAIDFCPLHKSAAKLRHALVTAPDPGPMPDDDGGDAQVRWANYASWYARRNHALGGKK